MRNDLLSASNGSATSASRQTDIVLHEVVVTDIIVNLQDASSTHLRLLTEMDEMLVSSFDALPVRNVDYLSE